MEQNERQKLRESVLRFMEQPSNCIDYELQDAVSPTTILSLLDENKRLESELRHEQRQVEAKTMLMNKAYDRVENLENVLGDLLACPMIVDEATVPKAGIEAHPAQVVFNFCCSYSKIKRAREALEGEK